ncbi:MAG: recombinase family protein, partial [Candidatus Eisenbacteria bacterium]
MRRVAFYTRISTDEDKQKYSLDAQHDRLEAFCQGVYGDAGYTLVEVFRDTESGAHLNRPALTRMLADAEAGRFDELIVFRVDRLSRKLNDLGPMVERLTQWGVAFRSVSESFDTASPSGRAMMQLLGVFGELERETIIERTIVGMERKARTGVWVGGTVPYGYRIRDDKKGIVIHEDEAFIVRRAFTRYATGAVGVRSLRDELTGDGHWKRTGRPWDARCLLHMLRNPVYVGKLRWKTEMHQGTHEAIVPAELFARAGAVLRGRADDLKGRQWHTGSERLATGLIFCSKCGRGMVGVSGLKNGKRTAYYACNGRLTKSGCRMDYIRADLLEGQIIAGFQDLFRTREMVERVWREAQRLIEKERPEIEAEAGKVERDVARAEEQLDKYFLAFEDGTMKPGDCAPRVEGLKRQIEALTERRAVLARQSERLSLPTLDLDEVASLLADFERGFESELNAERKHLLHRLVKEVRVQSRDTAEVWYAFPQPVGAAQARV